MLQGAEPSPLMPVLRFWELAFIAYSKWGLKMAQNNWILSAMDDLESERLVGNRYHLAAFIDSLQCVEEVNVVLRGAPRYLTQLTGVRHRRRRRKESEY